jgi:hypothetical protein
MICNQCEMGMNEFRPCPSHAPSVAAKAKREYERRYATYDLDRDPCELDPTPVEAP